MKWKNFVYGRFAHDSCEKTLLGVQVGWDRGGTEPTGKYTFFLEK
jgi:hypothetical protein